MANAPAEGGDGSLRRRVAEHPWLVGLAVSAVFLLFGLDRSPMVLIEEAFYSSPAHDLVRLGRFSSSILGSSRGTNEAYLLGMPLHPLVLAGAYRVFGFEIWTTRLVSLIPLLLAGLLAYGLVLRGTGDKQAGALAMLLILTEPQLVAGARGGRPDALMVMFFIGAFGLALISGDRTGRVGRWMAAGAGFLASLSFLSHIAGVTAFIAGGSALVMRERLRDGSDRRLWYFIAGASIPLVPYGIYGLEHSRAFSEQIVASVIKYSWGEGNVGAWVSRGIWNWFGEFRRVPLTGILYFAVPLIGLLGWVRGRARKELAAASVAWLVLLPVTTLLFPLPHHQLSAEMLVFLSCGWAVSISQWSRSQRARTLVAVLLVAGIAWQAAVSYVGKAATVAVNWAGRDPDIPARLIRKHVPEGAMVIGSPDVFYAALGQKRGFYLPVRDPAPDVRFDFAVTSDGNPPPKEWAGAGGAWELEASEEPKGWRFSDRAPWLRFLDSPSHPVYKLYLWRRAAGGV